MKHDTKWHRMIKNDVAGIPDTWLNHGDFKSHGGTGVNGSDFSEEEEQ